MTQDIEPASENSKILNIKIKKEKIDSPSTMTDLCDVNVVVVCDNLFESRLYINNDDDIHNNYHLWPVRYS